MKNCNESSATETPSSPPSPPPSMDDSISLDVIQRAAAGDHAAQTTILNRYLPVIRHHSRRPIEGMERADIEQELRVIACFVAPKKYLTSRREGFNAWVWVFLRSHTLQMWQVANRLHAVRFRAAVCQSEGTEYLCQRSRERQPPDAASDHEAIAARAGQIFDFGSDTMRASSLLGALGFNRRETGQILVNIGWPISADGPHNVMPKLAYHMGLARGSHGTQPVAAIKNGQRTTYPSASAAARALGMKSCHISTVANGHRRSARGYMFRFIAPQTAGDSL